MVMKTAICTLIKDEHRYLEEWITHNLDLGVDEIHLFEDQGSKSHCEICEKYSAVVLHPYKEVEDLFGEERASNRQTILYEWFAKKYKGVFDWVMYIDIDEFVMMAPGYTLKKLCEEFEPYCGIYLRWKMFGASGHIKRPCGSVVESYTTPCVDYPQGELEYSFKSVVNINRFEGMKNLHKVINGRTTDYKTTPYEGAFEKAWINHYFTKSWEDWKERIFDRGSAMPGHRVLANFFDYNADMEHNRENMILEEADRIPKGTYWLDKKNKIIAGWNAKDICREIMLRKEECV